MKTEHQHQLPVVSGGSRSGFSRRAGQLAACSQVAFSLIEVMVAVTLLTVIVVGLLMMFNQTQRAFRGSITQTDVLEAGRATMEMLAQELEQMAAAHLNAANLYVTNGVPLLQVLPPQADNVKRINVLQDVFFLTCVNQRWYAIGYRVDPPGAGAGTLYRFYTNVPTAGVSQALLDFLSAPPGSLNRVADGIVHFRVRAYDTDGVWVAPTNAASWTAPPPFWYRANILANPSSTVPGDVGLYVFRSNAIPASVELELGILEPPVLDRFRAMTSNLTAARNFLSGRVGGVHLFRQRIPMRNVDPEAYR